MHWCHHLVTNRNQLPLFQHQNAQSWTLGDWMWIMSCSEFPRAHWKKAKVNVGVFMLGVKDACGSSYPCSQSYYSEDPWPTRGLRNAIVVGRNCYSFTTEIGKCHPWRHLVLFLCFIYVFPPKSWIWPRVTTPLGKNKLFLTQSMLRNRNRCTTIVKSYTFLGNAFQEKWLCHRVTIIEMIQNHL